MAIKRSTEVLSEFSMSGLADIIFLLLIFFMLTSNFVTLNALNLHLPQADAVVRHEDRINVSITKDLEYYIGEKQVDFLEIPVILDQMIPPLKEGAEYRGTIVLNVDRDVSTGETVRIMVIGKKLKAKIILATSKEQ